MRAGRGVVPSPRTPRARALGGWGGGLLVAGRLLALPWPRSRRREREREGETLCVFQVPVVGARISNLFFSREGKSRVRPSRGRGAGGTEGARVARLTGAAKPRG